MNIANFNINAVNTRLANLLDWLAAARLTDAGVDREVRGRERASDHAPVWITLD